MLYKSGNNLKKGVIDFIYNNESITLFSAYIKLEELKSINIKKTETKKVFASSNKTIATVILLLEQRLKG